MLYPHSYRHTARNVRTILVVSVWLAAASVFLLPELPLGAQVPHSAQNEEKKPADQASIEKRLQGLRQVPDEERGQVTKQLALDIRQLSEPVPRLQLASGLANLATEGDFGHDTLQEVATTLADALRASPVAGSPEKPASPYITLAQLVRYEHVKVSLNDPQFAGALSKLDADDRRREQADFTLTDLQGKSWTLKALRGKVVLVNFWATWCPPCRKELPDLEALYNRFKGQGLVILGISDEDQTIVRPFVTQQKLSYPILLDPGRKVNTVFGIESIPRSLIYGRNGKLAAEAIDMRTQKQFLALLAQTGIH